MGANVSKAQLGHGLRYKGGHRVLSSFQYHTQGNGSLDRLRWLCSMQGYASFGKYLLPRSSSFQIVQVKVNGFIKGVTSLLDGIPAAG